MSAVQNLPDDIIQFSKVEHVLQQLNCNLHPSEVHGLMCGLVSVENIDKAYNHLKDYLYKESQYELLEDEEALFNQYLLIVYNQLSAHDFSLSLLLPDDDEPLQDRVNALALWCQGFLTGLSLVHRTVYENDKRGKHIAKSIQEVSLDFARIGDLQSHYLESDELIHIDEDEVAYTELVEYTRMAILTLFMELSPLLLSPTKTYH